MSLRTGITTGTCAAAAARAAAAVLAGLAPPAEVAVELPEGRTVIVPVLRAGVSVPTTTDRRSPLVPDGTPIAELSGPPACLPLPPGEGRGEGNPFLVPLLPGFTCCKLGPGWRDRW